MRMQAKKFAESIILCRLVQKNHYDISNIALKYPKKSKQSYNRIRNMCRNQQMCFTFAQR